jgi:hypothetical protein
MSNTCPICGGEIYVVVMEQPGIRLVVNYYCRLCGKIKFENERKEKSHDTQAADSSSTREEA